MMRDEFTKIFKERYPSYGPIHLSDKAWQIIETVYNYHPSIDDKMQIVALFRNYGMAAITDMYSRACMIRDLSNEQLRIRNRIKDLNHKIHEYELERERCENKIKQYHDKYDSVNSKMSIEKCWDEEIE